MPSKNTFTSKETVRKWIELDGEMRLIRFMRGIEWSIVPDKDWPEAIANSPADQHAHCITRTAYNELFPKAETTKKKKEVDNG
jgi:hypothetical protein